jgi:hypothetical protein
MRLGDCNLSKVITLSRQVVLVSALWCGESWRDNVKTTILTYCLRAMFAGQGQLNVVSVC